MVILKSHEFTNVYHNGNSIEWNDLRLLTRKRRRYRRQNGLIGCTSMLNDDGMAACCFLGIFMTQKVPGSLSEVSRDSTKPTEMIAEQDNNFWKDCENVIPS